MAAPPTTLTSPSTSPHISHLSTCDPSLDATSFLLFQQPLILLSTPLCFFFPKASCSSQPIPLSQPPASISLPLPKTLLSPLSLTHPRCHLSAPLSCTQENRRFYLPNCANDTCLCLPLSVSDNNCRCLLHQAIIKIHHFIPRMMEWILSPITQHPMALMCSCHTKRTRF